MKFSFGERDPIWLRFKYERLPNFCYYCGCLGHLERECTITGDISVGIKDLPYGRWWRADFEGRRRMGEAQGWYTREKEEPGRNMDDFQDHSSPLVIKKGSVNYSIDSGSEEADHIMINPNEAMVKEKEEKLFGGSVTVFSISSKGKEKAGEIGIFKYLGQEEGRDNGLGPSPRLDFSEEA